MSIFGNRRRRLRVTGAVVGLAVAIAACGSTSPSGSAAKNTGAAGGGLCSTSKPLTFDVIGTLSGPGSSYGIDQRRAMNLAVNQVNAKGGVDGCKLQPTYQDDTGQPTEAATLMRSDAPSSLFVVGPFVSSEFEAAYPIGDQQGVPMIEPSVSVGDLITKSQPWSFDTFIPSNLLLPQGAGYFYDVVHPTSVVGIVNTQDAASQAQEGAIVSALQSKGAQLTKTIDVTSGQAGYGPEVQQVKSLNPSAIVVGDLPSDSASIVKSLRQAGVTAPIMIGFLALNPDFLNITGSTANNVYVYTPYWYGIDTPRSKAFRTAYLKLSNGTEPGISAPASYDAVNYIAQALKTSGVLTSNGSLAQKRKRLRDALAAVKNFPGVTGDWSMGKDGIRTGSAVWVKLVNGNVTSLPIP